jgi:hypothetical protein
VERASGESSGVPASRELRALPSLADLPDGELMRALEAHGAEVRAVLARATALSRELAKRSAKSLGRDALSKRAGYSNSTIAAAHLLGVPYNFARQLHSVGEATSTRITLQGEVLPPRYEHVADSVAGAVLPVEYAGKIVEFLDEITPRVDPMTLIEAEAALVDAAPGLTSRELVQVIAGMASVLDPDGVEPTEAEAYAGRYFDMTVLPTGQVRIKGLLDAASAAPILAGVNAYVTNELRKSRGANNPDGSVTGVVRDVDRDRTEGEVESEGEASPIVQETRTVRQLRADAFIMLCQHAIGCNELPGCSTQVVVRMQDRDLIDRARDARDCSMTLTMPKTQPMKRPVSTRAARSPAPGSRRSTACPRRSARALPGGCARRRGSSRSCSAAQAKYSISGAHPASRHPPSAKP